MKNIKPITSNSLKSINLGLITLAFIFTSVYLSFCKDISVNSGNAGLINYIVDFEIQTDAISPISYCSGGTVNVPFTVLTNFYSGNIFTAELSDASGSFVSPVNIGTLTTEISGNINAVIPSNTPNGTGYRIRVVSSNPVVIGNDNGTDINIFIQTIIPDGPTTFCNGGSITLTATAGSTYLWNTGATTQSILVNTSGTYSTSVDGCPNSNRYR